MKSNITRYISFGILKEKYRWYAYHPMHGSLGGTRLKRELIELMEEKYNADVMGRFICVPRKVLNR